MDLPRCFRKNTIGILWMLVVVPLFVSAQISVENVVTNANPISVSASPENPVPNERVTIKVASSRFSVDESTITWYVNGEQIRSGIGAKETVLTVGSAGSALRVTVVVEHKKFGTFEVEKTFRPAEVTLVWEADTYTPPFYRGKALPASQADTRIMAFPRIIDETSGRLVPARELVYLWKVDFRVIEDRSGYGRNTLEFQGAKVYEHRYVTVDVSTVDGLVTAHAAASISAIQPEIVLYENRPLEGVVYDTALTGSVTIRGEESAIRAEPYFFSHSEPVETRWALNGNAIEVDGGGTLGWREVTFRKPEDVEGGASRVTLDVNATERFLQFASANLLIQFGTFEGFFGNFFGF
ncbi:MAG: hypothetical protein COW88_02160 [Candidatus Lloydbacteria bacterium CG22_combo_CG10-13_8_21_14_all_47_15]|uniref:Uncharacterized protein n=1 Tax=Candidatus Lloydbacteria bacterium CG22_combo_CG10-13_8_21_14_all_47_15 TaxID=1974635 RepID=A0A2H0CVI3_9BACT|nr:MAG: hypothetical protein COW88_02160 [Candidatus Lloydbacteria bacterium CG22_combo_CG10-13_8_21_14_all_47_15]